VSDCLACGAPLPADARFCPSCGAAVEGPAPAAEERKLATVLFVDVVGSTALGGSQDPERTRAMLDRYYKAASDEITAAGGTVEKFIGDAVMAVFGVPAALEDHAERALHAALATRRRVKEVFGEGLEVRIGVNTGEVVAGRAPGGGSFVTGDAVNVAARLEQAAAPGEILVGLRTAEAAKGAFEFGERLLVEAKGKEGGVGAAQLVRALSLMRPRGVGALRRAFVGRERDLDLLLATYARVVQQREPHMVTLAADAGVGKTRLVRELWALLADETPEPLRRTGRCLPYGRGITYWPLGEVLKEHLGLLESDSPETVRERLGEHEILGLALGLDVAPDLHPIQARDRFHDAWLRFLEALASDRPLVLLIEDIHWAEEPLLDLIERILREVRAPVLVIATGRPELLDARPAWGGGVRNASTIWLEPLSRHDSARLLDALVGEALPERLRDLVVDHAEGNPFFVEELVRTLIDRGLLEHRDGGWQVNDVPDDFEAPDSVHAVLAARIDLLPSDQKLALQAASVIGRTFWDGPLRALIDEEPDLELLEDRDFVRRSSGSSLAGHREYVVKHALTREVAYGSLPKGRRARLHAAFAGWLEETGEGRDEHVPLLAHHYGQAVEDADLAWGNDPDELRRLERSAARWLRRAGELAVGRYELADGISLLHRALELAPDPDDQAELWREIGRANALGFHGREFWEAMERSLELTEEPRLRGATYAELAVQTATRSAMWRRRPDRAVVHKWIDQALELTEPETPARVKALSARGFWAAGVGVDAAREAVSTAERLGDPDLQALALGSLSLSTFTARRFEESHAAAAEAVALVPAISDPEAVSFGYESLVPVETMLGRFAEARAMAGRFDEAVQRLSPHHRMHGVAVRAELDELMGDWSAIDKALPRIERAVTANLGTPCIRNERTLLIGAAARTIAGDKEEAARLEERAASLAMEGYDEVLAAQRLRLALLRGERDEAERLLRFNVPTGGTGAWFWFSVPALPARLDALIALGDRDRVEDEAEPLLELHGTYLEPFAQRSIGHVRGDRGLVEAAMARFEAMQLPWHVEQTRALLP
jgi:class 3 adenylate cyclase/tetratricopeptide (TPR) repeat protein